MSCMRFLAHITVSVLALLASHEAYKLCFSKLSGYPRGYSAATGYILLATWAPVVREMDFPDPSLAREVFASLTLDKDDTRLRNDHLFNFTGLIWLLRELLPDYQTGEAVARQAALRALMRDPLEVMGLGVQTFCDFFDLEYLRKMVLEDLAYHQLQEYKEFKERFSEKLTFPPSDEQPETFLKKYYLWAIPWYLVVLFTPLLALIALLRASPSQRPAIIALGVTALYILCVCTFLTVQPVVRYLHPLSWISSILWGCILGSKASSTS